MHSPRTRGNFGAYAIELAGIMVDPMFQKSGIGTKMVKEFLTGQSCDYLTAYTRNPGVLRILGKVGCVNDILDQKPAIDMPYAIEYEGVTYHIGRYGPNGLYGEEDPADRMINGVVLKERCKLLVNPNNALALAVAVNRKGGRM